MIRGAAELTLWTPPMLDKPLDRPLTKTDPALLARFAAIVGDRYAITDPSLQAPYLVEMRNLFEGHTPMVLRPASVAMKFCITTPLLVSFICSFCTSLISSAVTI